jgi:TetR/AcrR family transcriptional repressor of nem operon
MRYPAHHKEEVRRSVVKAASRALRRDGLAGVSIPALMRKAGLTHGGFYAHFKNREQLVAEAVRAAAQETATSVLNPDRGGLEAILDAYLSPEHVAGPAGGCVLAALGSEARHHQAPVRRAFTEAARGFFGHLQASLHPRGSTRPPDDDTLELAARMVGAVVLARLVDDPLLAKQILAAARQASPHTSHPTSLSGAP